MRKHLLTTVVFGLGVAARATPARADVGLGLFLGEPTGIDLKVEIALAFVFIDPANDLALDVQGGGGLRVYF